MDIQTILDCLNSVAVRATYGAVGEVLGVRPQVVPRLLGARRPEASWVVNGTTGEPTGYAPDETDPRLPGTHVIRTGDELRACLEGSAPAAPEAVPPEAAAPQAAAPQAVPPEAVPIVNAAPGPATPEPEPFGMNSDARWIIGTLVPVFLLVAGLLAAQIASVSRGLHTRIDEVNDRIDELTEQIAGVDARVDDVRTEVQDEIAVLRSDVGGIAERLPAVEPASDLAEPSVAPGPDAGEQALESDAPEASPDAPETSPDAPEASPDAPETSPDAPEISPDAQPEPAADAGAPVVTPAPPGE